jgi:signal transduction histidine kinase
VEAYESLASPGVIVRADDRTFAPSPRIKLPAGTSWLTFSLQPPSTLGAMTLGFRWRLVGRDDEWHVVGNKGIAECRGLPPGRYEFQAQLRHSDYAWNQATVSVPILVPMPWWKSPAFQFGAVAFVVALASLAGWQIARRRMARRLVELERRGEFERERARIARDMHDVIGARLTQLAVMQDTFATEHPQTPAAAEQLHRLAGTAREAVVALDEAVWAVNPRNDMLQNVANYLCHAATDYLAPLGIACRQDVSNEWPQIVVGAQKRHQLLLAFKEAMQNVAKHAAASRVTLTLRHEPSSFLLRVEDNGRGLPADLAGVGKDGVANMQSRLESVGGACTLRSGPDGGTVVEMRIPL